MSTKFKAPTWIGLRDKSHKMSGMTTFLRSQTLVSAVGRLAKSLFVKVCGLACWMFVLIILFPISIAAGFLVLVSSLRQGGIKRRLNKTSGSASISKPGIVLQFPTLGRPPRHGQDFISLESLAPDNTKSYAADTFISELSRLIEDDLEQEKRFASIARGNDLSESPKTIKIYDFRRQKYDH